MRFVHRSLSNSCVDDDDRLRDGRRQPRGSHLGQGPADHTRGPGYAAAATPDDTGQHRRGLLPRRHRTPNAARPMMTLAGEAVTRTSTSEAVMFWILGALAVAGALGVVMAAKAVYSALFLA